MSYQKLGSVEVQLTMSYLYGKVNKNKVGVS